MWMRAVGVSPSSYASMALSQASSASCASSHASASRSSSWFSPQSTIPAVQTHVDQQLRDSFLRVIRVVVAFMPVVRVTEFRSSELILVYTRLLFLVPRGASINRARFPPTSPLTTSRFGSKFGRIGPLTLKIRIGKTRIPTFGPLFPTLSPQYLGKHRPGGIYRRGWTLDPDMGLYFLRLSLLGCFRRTFGPLGS